MGISRKISLIVSVLIFFFAQASWTQTTIKVRAAGDIFTLPTDPDSVRVCADRCQKEMDVAVVRIIRAGFYHILPGVEYSEGQGNESFYVQFRRPDGTFAPQLEPNAGTEKVVADTSFIAFSMTRDAGKFYLSPGIYTIHLRHYYFLQNEFPQYLNPVGVFMTGQSPESVHIYNFQFSYEGDREPRADIFIEKFANSDSALAGEELRFTLQISNFGPDSSGAIHISDALPEFMQFITADPAPDSMKNNMLHWHLSDMSKSEVQRINYTAIVTSDIPDSINEQINSAVVEAPFDTNMSNNFASDTIFIKRQTPKPAPRCDLAIRKTTSSDTIAGFAPFNFRITVTNLGPDSAFQIIVIDSLPQEINIVQYLPQPDSSDGQKIFWFPDPLAPGDSAIFSLSAQIDSNFAAQNLLIENNARTDAVNDTIKENNHDQSSAFIYWEKPPQPQFCDVSINKTVSTDTIGREETAIFALSIRNAGPAVAKEIVVTDTLPAMLEAFDFSAAPDSVATPLLVWKIDSLKMNEESVISFQVRLLENYSDTIFQIINYAEISAAADTFAANNRASAELIYIDESEVKIKNCDLTVKKSASKDSLFAGDTLRYFISIQNLTQNTSRWVTLMDSLPEFMAPKIFSQIPDSSSSNMLFWFFDSLTGMEEKVVSFSAEIDSNFVGNSTLRNTAMISAGNDTNSANNRDEFSVFVREKVTPPPVFHCDLKLTKEVDKDTVHSGERLRYLITVENLGKATAREITVIDTLPALVLPLGTTPRTDSLSPVLHWQFDSLAPGEKIEISILARIAATDSQLVFPMINFASVRADQDTNTSNNFDTATTFVAPVESPENYRLELKKEATKDSVQIGETFDYEISALNLGPDVAREITIVDSMTSAIVPQNFSPEPDSSAGTMYFWFIDSLCAGETQLFIITAKLDSQYATADSAVFNVAGIFSKKSDNISGYRVQARIIPTGDKENKPKKSPKLELSKSADKDTVKVGEAFTYFIDISNSGAGTAYNIAVIDTLPVQISISNVNPKPDSATENILFWHIDSLSAGEIIQIQYDAVIADMPTGADFSLQNVAIVSAENDTNLVGDRAKRHRIVIAEEEHEKEEPYNLVINKTADCDTVKAGDSFTYTLRVFNHGPGVAFHVTLFDSLPELISASDFNPEPDSVFQKKLFWFVDTLLPGHEFVASFRATLEKTLPKTIMPILNIAAIFSPRDTSTTDDQDDAEIIANVETETLDCDHSYYFSENVFDPNSGIPLHIHFQISSAQVIELDLYDIRGYHISTIAEKFYHKGENIFSWDGRLTSGQRAGSGLYIIALRTEEMNCWKKVIIVR